MGVVRREGDWRLERRDEGMYEVTYGGRVEAKIFTSDYSPDGFTDERHDFAVPVREVSSFSEAEQTFQDMTRGNPSFTENIPTTASEDVLQDVDFDDDDLPGLPPGGILAVFLIIGGYLLFQSGFAIQSTIGLIAMVFLAGSMLLVGYTCYLYASKGSKAALIWLITVQEDGEQSRIESIEDELDTGKTPPAPQSLKDKLHIQRADQQCEWCETQVDSPDVHHIEPRSEGGANTPENLIVLCPNCHRKADRGAISRSKLRLKVESQMERWDA